MQTITIYYAGLTISACYILTPRGPVFDYVTVIDEAQDRVRELNYHDLPTEVQDCLKDATHA